MCVLFCFSCLLVFLGSEGQGEAEDCHSLPGQVQTHRRPVLPSVHPRQSGEQASYAKQTEREREWGGDEELISEHMQANNVDVFSTCVIDWLNQSWSL